MRGKVSKFLKESHTSPLQANLHEYPYRIDIRLLRPILPESSHTFLLQIIWVYLTACITMHIFPYRRFPLHDPKPNP